MGHGVLSSCGQDTFAQHFCRTPANTCSLQDLKPWANPQPTLPAANYHPSGAAPRPLVLSGDPQGSSMVTLFPASLFSLSLSHPPSPAGAQRPLTAPALPPAPHTQHGHYF